MFPNKAFSACSVSSLKINFRDIQQMQKYIKGDLIQTPFTMDNFDYKGTLKQWVENPKIDGLVLVGKSGIGKTQFAKALCKHNKWKTLLVSHKQDFQRIDTCYDAIIVEYANFNDFNHTQKLALLYNSNDKSIRVLYTTVSKRQEVVTMLLMNHMQYAELHKTFKQKAV